MALLPLSPQFPGMNGLQNLLRDHLTPEFLPAQAGGRPPAVAVPNARPAAAADELQLSSEPAPRREGSLVVDGSGLYRTLQASAFALSAQSLEIRTGGAGGWGSAAGAGAGRGALSALSAALESVPDSGGSLMERLEDSLKSLGVSEEGIRDLLLIARMLGKLDPEALEKLVDSLESFAKAAGGAPDASSAAGAAQPAQTAQSGQASFQIRYVSLRVSVTEVSAQASSGPDGEAAAVSARHIDIRFERLEISMGRQELQQGDPVVMDLDGDGADLRATSDGVLFDVAGTGRAVRTAFVAPDDALLFYDANGNGLLDGGAELVGNRSDGANGFEELAAMDADGDGWVTAADPDWQFLRLFQDADGDGRAVSAETLLLEALGISGLSALWERDEAEEGEGLSRVGTSAFRRADGSAGVMYDYYFGYRPA